MTFGRALKDRAPEPALFAEDLGGLLALLSFLGFGAVLLGPLLDDLTWQAIAYAVLSLTVVRIVPVAVSLLGTGLARPTVVFAGWFAPRGLASIVFGLLVAEEALPDGSVILQAVFVTVALSVVLHGATAVWGANRYGRWYEQATESGRQPPESADVGEPSVRRRVSVHGGPHDPMAGNEELHPNG